ncbi:MAG: protein phosphatase 2C domain-containing protein [Lachnospiraceae bacterium]|nr:protein phosphatase 2C domain-containing protein [Lachnospiraceae bacterium]
MIRKICGKSVTGASHIRAMKPCQDNYKCLELSDTVTVLAVADGHGSERCPYSKTGSQIAVNTFCSVIKNLLTGCEEHDHPLDFLMSYLNREGELRIAQTIEEEWKNRVWKAHRKNKRDKVLDAEGNLDLDSVYRQYGTTLLGLLITPEFLFGFQLGDGDILRVDAEQVQPVIMADKILGTETHSLSSRTAWKKAITVMRSRDETAESPHLYLMSTDGFANSYPSTEAFEQTCKEYFEMIQEHGFETVAGNLKDWLNETSEQGCGDDITVVLAYFS